MNKIEVGCELVTSKWPKADAAERERLMLEMKQRGLSIMDAIRVLSMSKFYSLAEAKTYVSESPAWRLQAESGKVLQEIALEVLDDFAGSQHGVAQRQSFKRLSALGQEVEHEVFLYSLPLRK